MIFASALSEDRASRPSVDARSPLLSDGEIK